MSANIPQNPDVVKAFKKHKFLFNVQWYLGCAFLAVGLLSIRNPGLTFTSLPVNVERWIALIAAAALFTGAIFAWRCPVCKKFFWINTRVISCSKCKTVFLPESKRPFW